MRLIPKFELRAASSAGLRNFGRHVRSMQAGADHEVAMSGRRGTSFRNEAVS
jgi:hypothetical protein